MLNNISIMGRIVRDLELRHTQNGVAACLFTIACERDYKPQNGERETDFIDVQAWRNTAEFVTKYFKKGDLCAIKGRLQARTYEDKNGVKRKAVEVMADSVYFAGSKQQAAAGGQQQGAAGADNGGFYPIDESIDDDDFPF